MNTEHGRTRSRLLLGAALAFALSSLGGTLAFGADASTPSSNPQDRHDMVTSDDTRTNTVGKQPDVSTSKVSRADRHFLEKAAKSGMEELKIAQLGVARAWNSQVKSFAEKLVSDHMQSNRELSELAGRKGVSLVDRDAEDRHFKNLTNKTGEDFDKRFIRHMAAEHADDIELYEKTSRKSDDPDIAAYAAKQLPVLQDHQQQAVEIQKSLKR